MERERWLDGEKGGWMDGWMDKQGKLKWIMKMDIWNHFINRAPVRPEVAQQCNGIRFGHSRDLKPLPHSCVHTTIQE